MSQRGRASKCSARPRCPVLPGSSAMNALTGTGARPGSPRWRSSPTRRPSSPAASTPKPPASGTASSAAGPTAWPRCASDRIEFAAYWDAHNDRLLTQRDATGKGDTATRCGSSSATPPRRASARLARAAATSGRPCTQLRRTHRPALAGAQPLRLRRADPRRRSPTSCRCSRPAPGPRDLRGGANDILYSAPGKLFSDLRALLAAVPEDTVMLDLPLLTGFWGIVGQMSVPYITRINRVICEVATERGLRVAEVQRSSSRRGPASSPATTSTRARTATATGPGPSSPPSPAA